MHLRVQIPAHNEAATLAAVVREVTTAARDLLRAGDRLSVLIIDDGSTDATPAVCARLLATVPELAVRRNPRRQGLGASFRLGVAAALQDAVDVLAHIDADGQFDAAELALLVPPVRDAGFDLVVGSRFLGRRDRVAMPAVRRYGNFAVAWLVSSLAGRRLTDVSCGFRAFSRRALATMQLQGDFTYTHETILQASFAGLAIDEVAVSAGRRRFGASRLARSSLVYGVRAGRIIWRTALHRRDVGRP